MLLLKLDENLGARHARMAHEHGCEARTVLDENLCSASDAEVIDAARAEGRILITLDKDFSNTVRFPPDQYGGIVVLRLHEPIPSSAIDRAMAIFFAAAAGRSPAHRLWIIDGERVREFSRPDLDMPPGQ
jgi:predicted nuclease of predicted toxin-antitoxin system